jgi:E3 ubiquitin-protein ligase TRIP12
MSTPRITRAAARQAASSSESSGISTGASSAASSTRPPAPSRKRKAPAREPSPALDLEPAKPSSARRIKRLKVSDPEPPQPPSTPAVVPSRRRKGKTPAVMSSPG